MRDRIPITPRRLRGLLVVLAVVLAVFLGGVGAAGAVMPPHTDRVEFEDGMFIVHGYSLRHADVDEQLRVVDVESGEPVDHTHTVACRTENRCDGAEKPGCIQYDCELTVTLTRPEPDQRVRLSFLEAQKTVVANPTGADGADDSEQADDRPTPPPPSERKVTVRFDEVTVDEAAAFMKVAAGRRYVVSDAALDCTFTWVEEEPMPVDEVVEAFEAKLKSIGLRVVERNGKRHIEAGGTSD